MENYHCGKQIGKGSYGEVWLVRNRKDKKQYVLKQINLQYASKRELRAANLEVQLLATLKHPNIVSYRDSFESHDGFLYIVMGYCEGGDLYTQIKLQKGIPFEENQVVEWFIQISMALQYLHERNILHRDLKTQNIFLTKSKIIKVGDLGIAKVLDGESAMATTLIGTPYYMSPELFSNRPYNHKSDVWALGCCIYEIATLRHAFNARDMNSLMYKIIRGKLPAMPKKYSTELQDLIRALLNHNADRRPSVSRILRHPYIKKNIAIFLEGTRLKQKSPVQAGRSAVYIVNPSESAKTPKALPVKDQEVRTKSAKTDSVPCLSIQGMKLSKEAERPAAASASDACKPHSNGAICNGAVVPSDCQQASSGARDYSTQSASGDDLSLFVDGQEIKLEDRFGDRRNSDGSNGSAQSQKQSHSSPSKNVPQEFANLSVGNGAPSPRSSPKSTDERARKITRMRRLKDAKPERKMRNVADLADPNLEQTVLPDASQIRRPNREARQRRRLKLLAQNGDEFDSGETLTVASVEVAVLNENELETDCDKIDSGKQGVSPPGYLSTNSNSDQDYEHLIGLLNTTLKVDLESPPSSTSLTPEKRRRNVTERDSDREGGEARCASRLELRIHALEKDCLHGLGKSLLGRAMDAIVNKDTKELQDELLVILGKENYNDFIGKLWQLRLCQESMNPEDP